MSTLKKLLALTLALAMVLSVSVFAGNYSNDTYADAADIHDDCVDAVEVMYALDIMVGDGTNFKPEQAISRKEMAKIIYVIMNGGNDDKAVNYVGNSIFSDVPATEWYNGYVNYCAMTKKIQGYNGKFEPDATLTVAAAAKMLLTAIGYDAEAYGFVGPNWENNVLTVAHEVGLLEDVSTNLTGAAARQWVAKMIMNSLDAYCYKTVAAIPGNGILNNYWVNSGNDLTNITTFGEKYLNVTIKTGYLVATTKANLDATDFAASKTVTFDFDDVEVDVKGTGLTAADLGQQFTVVIKDGEAKSVRNTGKSVVGEAAIKDVTAKLTYSTSDNNEKNRYEFTIGDLTGKLNVPDETAAVKVLDIEYNNGEKLVKTTHTAAELKGFMTSEGVKNNTVKAIDKDADGDIDYIIYTPVEYAKVTKVGTSSKYGDYVKMDDVNGDALAVKGNTNLYVEDLINCEDEAYMAAAGGFTMGIMRHPYRGAFGDGRADMSFPSVHRDLKSKMHEVIRAVRWHRIAPAFAADSRYVSVSACELTDTWRFAECSAEIEEWWLSHPLIHDRLSGNTVTVTAPAAIARNCGLPDVEPDERGDVPYVIAARHEGGAFSVATLGRTRKRDYWIPRCRMSVDIGSCETVGIFGEYGELVLRTEYEDAVRVLAQDLASERAVDITDEVSVRKGMITVSGELIRSVGTSAQGADDTSEPGLLLRVLRA